MRYLALLTLLLIAPQAALAWGAVGHQLVCGAAEEHLSKAGRQFVKEVSGNGKFLAGGKLPFPQSCLWPDKVKYSTRKDTYEHHFLNIPATSNSINLKRDCASLSCLPVGIQRSITYLGSPAAGEREKGRQAAALRYLGHYLGDLHQPLHVSHAEDWGGNKIKVSWYSKKSNLHSVWDTNLIDKSGLTFPGSTGMIAKREVNPGAINIPGWFEDSYRLTRSRAYRHPDGSKVKSGDKLGYIYFQANKELVTDQIALSAQRLALVINAIAAGKLPSALGLNW
jgi:hypothetical protein